MDAAKFQAARGYRPDPSGHRPGVSCDAHGPAWGPIRLLQKTGAGFVPRPVEELNHILSKTFGQTIDCAGLMPGLGTIARALDDGDLARAAIATQHLRLPVLGPAEAERPAAAKASPDDPKHPGWPAGTQGGLGGRFRPKDGLMSEQDRTALRNRMRRLIVRRTIRQGLRRLLEWRRLLRLSGEVASNAAPGIDVAGDVGMAVDVVGWLNEFESLRTDTDAALEFSSEGPYTLDELRASDDDESFDSFDAFKKVDLIKRFGPAGRGYEWHHIVEQRAGSHLPARLLQSTRNIIRIPKLLHEEVNSEFEQDDEGKGSPRSNLRGQSFEQQWQEGIRILRKVGILK